MHPPQNPNNLKMSRSPKEALHKKIISVMGIEHPQRHPSSKNANKIIMGVPLPE